MDTHWSGEAKYQTLLAVSQAANSQRDLSSVLQAVADALEGLVPVDGIGVFTYERERARTRAIYFRGVPRRSGESQQAYLRRFSEAAGAADGTHPARLRDAIERDRRTLVLDHVRTDPRGRDRSETLGAECGVGVPLTMGDEFVAGLVIGRRTPSPFTPDEVHVLEDVARPVTTAVANALAFEEIQKLRCLLEDENLALREEITAAAASGGIIGASAGLRDVLERVARVAATDSTVLITGETGTGKELVARAIHTGVAAERARAGQGQLRRHPGGAGRERAVRPREGRLHRRDRSGARAASSWPTAARSSSTRWASCRRRSRSKLLRVLQEREFERVGGSAHAAGRTCASSPPPTATWRRRSPSGTFRADLFFRLNVFPIRVPPLRERRRRHPAALPSSWLSAVRRARSARRSRGSTSRRWPCSAAIDWPGNVRELQNVVERAVILARGSLLGLSDFELPSLAAEPEVGTSCDGRSRRRASADRRGPQGEPRPRLWRRRRGGGARCAAQHARIAHPPPQDRQVRVPPSRLRPASRKPTGSTAGGRRASPRATIPRPPEELGQAHPPAPVLDCRRSPRAGPSRRSC